MRENHEKKRTKFKVIIYNYVRPSDENYEVNLNIYYRNLQIKNLRKKNFQPREPEAEDHCVNRYTRIRDNVTCLI